MRECTPFNCTGQALDALGISHNLPDNRGLSSAEVFLALLHSGRKVRNMPEAVGQRVLDFCIVHQKGSYLLSFDTRPPGYTGPEPDHLVRLRAEHPHDVIKFLHVMSFRDGVACAAHAEYFQLPTVLEWALEIGEDSPRK